MYCSQCRAEVAIDAKFCHKCGKPVEPPSSPTISKQTIAPEPVSLEPAKPLPRWFAILWKLRFASGSIVIGVLQLGLYSFVFMNLWVSDLDAKTIGYFMFFNGLAFRYSWKRFNRRGWVGAL